MCIFAQIATVKKKMLHQHHNPSLSVLFMKENRGGKEGLARL